MNRDLFVAILSMDSYNRGYGAGIKDIPDSGQLGNATLLAATVEQQIGWQSAGFYSIAYDMTGVAGFVEGERVIAYRGTDGDISVLGSAWDFIRSRLGRSTDNDVKNGYGIALGHPDGTQALLALEFYRAVAVLR